MIMIQGTESSCRYDVVVVGAGLVGLSVATALNKIGLRVVVLEREMPKLAEACSVQDLRPLTLAYGSRCHLDHWGIWPSLSGVAVPVRTLQVSRQRRLGRVNFSAAEMEIDALGYVVPFADLHRTLFDAVSAASKTEFILIDEVKAIQNDVDGAELTYNVADKIGKVVASLIIVADGTHSYCRQLLGISVASEKNDDVAFVATLQSEQPHQHTAYQRFTQQGSMALLPLPNCHHYRLVWTLSDKHYGSVSRQSDVDLLATLMQVYRSRVGRLSAIQRHGHWPLATIAAQETIRPSVVLLGNAANTIYPLAAQGFNISLRNVAVLVRILQQAIRWQEPIGALSTLQRYAENSESRQRDVINATQWIANVFGCQLQLPGFGILQGGVLLALDTLPYSKRRFARMFLSG